MDVEVASKLKKAIARSFAPSALVGDDMLVRLRSTTIGILGLVAAVGLGLVGFVSNQGWPGVFGGPLPQAPSRLVENDSISAPPTVAPRRSVQGGGHRPGRGSAHPPPASGREGSVVPVNTGVSPSGPVGASPPAAPGKDNGQAQSPAANTPPTVVAEAPPNEEHPTKASSSPEPPAATTSSPGHSGEAPGHSGDSPGHSREAPGRSREAPGHSGEAPGHSSEDPGHSGESQGHSGKSRGGRH